jgi:predicted nucleic acid-binding protein
MRGVVVVDTNLLLLLVVGAASPAYIAQHKRLSEYSADDLHLLQLIISEFAEIVCIPHILSEVSNLVKGIDERSRLEIMRKLRRFVEVTRELHIPSVRGTARSEFTDLGLTDAIILHLCNLSLGGLAPTLVTADRDLANRALALGCSVIDYRRDFMDP